MRTLLFFPLLAATFFGLGRLCLARVRFARAAETLVFSSALGMAVLGYLVFLLGALGRMTPPAVALVFGLCVAISLPVLAQWLRRLSWKPPRLTPVESLCLALLIGAALVNLLVTLNPVLESDSYEYHVPIPKAWLVAGRFFAMPYYLQSNYHLLGELLNAVALSISPNDMALCKLIAWHAGLLLAAATWCFGRSFFSARTAWVAAAVVYLIKDISWLSGTAYVDLTHGLFVWLGIFAMIRAAQLRVPAWHVLAGVFFGGAFASKQSGALFFAMAWLACGVVLVLEPPRRRQLGQWLAGGVVAGALMVLIASPWMAKNCLYANNPVFPFAARAFPMTPEYARAASVLTDYYGDPEGFSLWSLRSLDRISTAWGFSRRMLEGGGALLVFWMIAGGLVAALVRLHLPLALQILLALGLIAAPWFAWVPNRFLVGFFPAFVLFFIETLRRASGRRRALFALAAVALLSLHGGIFALYNSRTRLTSLSALGGPMLSMRAREQWLARNDPSYPVVQRVNASLARGDRLLAASSFPALAWIDAPFLPNPHTLAPPLPLLLWERFHDADAMRRWLAAQAITHVLIRRDEAEAVEKESGFVSGWMEFVFEMNGFVLYRLADRMEGDARDARDTSDASERGARRGLRARPEVYVVPTLLGLFLLQRQLKWELHTSSNTLSGALDSALSPSEGGGVLARGGSARARESKKERNGLAASELRQNKNARGTPADRRAGPRGGPAHRFCQRLLRRPARRPHLLSRGCRRARRPPPRRAQQRPLDARPQRPRPALLSAGGSGRDPRGDGNGRLHRHFRGADRRAPAGGAPARRARQGHRLHARDGARTRHGAGAGDRDLHRGRAQGERLAQDHRPHPRRGAGGVTRRRVLIVRLSAIGDVVHVLPALAALRRAWPDAHLAWLVESLSAPLLEGHPLLDEILVYPRKQWRKRGYVRSFLAGDVRRFFGGLRARRFDLAIDFQGLTKSAALPWLAGVPERIGYGDADAREASRWFYTTRCRPAGDCVHVVRRNLALLAPLAVPTEPVEFPFPDYAADRERLDRKLEAEGIGRAEPLVAINPGAGWETKRWPPAHCGALAGMIAREFGCPVLVTWGPGEEALVARTLEAVEPGLRGRVRAAPPTTLRELATLLDRARVAIGGDTGPIHLAAARGVPVVAIYGGSDPKRNGPVGPRPARVLDNPAIPCYPCWKVRCDCATPLACMTTVAPERVLAAVREAMERL